MTDLSVSATTDTSATLSLTQVSDGNGMAASYDVRFAVAPISWGSAATVVRGTCTTPLVGTTAGKVSEGVQLLILYGESFLHRASGTEVFDRE